MPGRALAALAALARHLPLVRRDPLAALDAIAAREGYEHHVDLRYGGHGEQRLDLYVPWGPAPEGGRSGLVFFHGGRWTFGQKAEYRFVAQALVARGLVVAVCDYRKFPAVRFPAFVEDGAAALAWALEHLPGHAVDPGRIFLMGHSAGAHIAALSVLDRRYTQGFGIDPDRIAGLILMSGPFDFYPIKGADLREIFGPEEVHPESQPLRYARPGAPPMLFLHGRRDRTVHPVNSARMASALRQRGGSARTILYDLHSHTSILGALSDRVGFLFAPVLADIEAFVRRREREILWNGPGTGPGRNGPGTGTGLNGTGTGPAGANGTGTGPGDLGRRPEPERRTGDPA